MPLDAALFTLLIRPRVAEPGWIDLDVYASCDSIPTLKAYVLHKDDRDGSFNAYDPYTLKRLGTSAIAPPSLPNAKPNPKHRLTRLFDPDVEVHLWNQPGLGWSWDMEWEETRYVWTREVGNLLSGERGFTLSASRKPDPNFPILQYHPQRKGGSIEILDHNRIEPRIRDRKGLEVASLLALCYFIEHFFPAAPVPPPTPAAATTSKPAEPAASADQPSNRKKEEQAPPAPPATLRNQSAPPTSSSRPQPSSPRSSPRIDITDLSPKAVEAHYRYCLALLGDPNLPALEFACRDPAGDDTLKALAERIKQKRLKLSRGSDSLDIQVSPILPQQAEQARGGWFGFFQAAGSEAATQPAATGISVRLSRVRPTAPNPSSSQNKMPIDRSTSSSSPSVPRQSPMAAPPSRKISPRPPAPPPRPVGVPKSTSREEVPTNVGTKSGPANPAPSAPQSGGSGWLSIFGQRAKG
ncbi:hypothetical protein C6P46_003121 [Rhodotorula mucilaginosa]|uniref:Uncharacterized protein n=1 Tax=Rhodotorula mucilaginosa TaxID=5537 RepID=A0A9P6W531_RHOMI|nr:hypothetical protein C6P46_003121 [Rhodotorula mucilaginosa]